MSGFPKYNQSHCLLLVCLRHFDVIQAEFPKLPKLSYILERIQIYCVLSVSWLRVVRFSILFLLWPLSHPWSFMCVSSLDVVFSHTLIPITNCLHKSVCTLLLCKGPLEHSDGERLEVAKYVVSSSERSYILQGGIRFPFRLSFHTFDAANSAMIRCGRLGGFYLLIRNINAIRSSLTHRVFIPDQFHLSVNVISQNVNPMFDWWFFRVFHQSFKLK